MPILRTSYSDQIIWLYHPTEIVDFQKSPKADTVSNLNIRSDYRISSSSGYSDTLPAPYPMPSLEEFNTGNLVHLELQQIDVTNMPRIPDSVRALTLSYTTLTDLREINVNWDNIQLLKLTRNNGLNGKSLIVPNGVKSLIIICQRFSIIRTPPSIQQFQSISTNIGLITGHMPLELSIQDTCQTPIYGDLFHMYEDLCYHELDDVHLDYDGDERYYETLRVIKKWHDRKVDHIVRYNNDYNSQMYLELGSIKHRIKNPVEHCENPMVAAVFLGSNYLRRAAEFMTEETIA